MLRAAPFVALSVLLAASALSANLTVPTEFRDVVADAGLVVRGTITDVRSVTAPGRGVESIATVAIEAVLKGDADEFVSIRVPGGQVGTRRFVMVGAPSFTPGDRAVLFLRRDPEGAWRPVGLSLGVYRVRLDRASGRPMVAPPVVGGWNASATGPIVRGDARRQSMVVQEFDALVRLIAAGRAVPARLPLAERPVK